MSSHAKRWVLLFAVCCISTTTRTAVHGFAPVSFPSTTTLSSRISAPTAAAPAISKRRQRRRRRTTTTTTFRLLASRSNNPVAGELTNTLARLDGLWRRQQSTFSRWHYLSVGNREDEIAYLLAPPAHHSAPSCIIVFTGGAGLGTYPQVAYNEFLVRVSNQLNAAVITVPYPVGLDHARLAERNGQLIKRALGLAQTRFGYYGSTTRQRALPIYSLAHSLGCKLACLDATSVLPQQHVHADGYGFISFNNFGFDQTFKMAKRFGETLRVKTGLGRNMEHEMLVDSFFSVADLAVRLSGVEFQPSPQSMLRILERQWKSVRPRQLHQQQHHHHHHHHHHHGSAHGSISSSSDAARITRLFTFDDDTMDSARDVVAATRNCSSPLQVSALPGTHLTPVYFDLRHHHDALLHGYFRASPRHRHMVPTPAFGDEIALQSLVLEVCSWIHGSQPSRVPDWAPPPPSPQQSEARTIQITSVPVQEDARTNSSLLVRR